MKFDTELAKENYKTFFFSLTSYLSGLTQRADMSKFSGFILSKLNLSGGMVTKKSAQRHFSKFCLKETKGKDRLLLSLKQSC